MVFLDDLFVFIFAVVYPIAGFIGFRRLQSKMQAGHQFDRNRLYVSTMSWHWIMFAAGLVVWADSGRSWVVLGFGLDLNTRFLIGTVLTVGAIALLVAQLRRVGCARQRDLDRVSSGFGDLLLIVPRNAGELALFNVLSVTAGIVEETLWRGFLIWYLAQSMPLWAAAMISAVGFGIAHGYQGRAHVPRVAAVGAVLAGLYVLAGSLWLPMALHAVVDLLQGRLAYHVLRRTDTVDRNDRDADAQTSS
ncbi:MAG: CPBP family intramembrane glutamic endopeptidase [Woeseia sp.]